MSSDLTDRERGVMIWAAEGKTAWETGVILGISTLTVRLHLQNARKKLNASNIAQACVLFDRQERAK